MTFYSSYEKKRNDSGHQAKKERQRKKVNRTTYNISSIKCVTRKFLEVSRCRLAKQRQRNVPKKVCCPCKVVFFFAIRPTVFFFWLFSLPSPLSITRFYICFRKLQILTRASLLPLAKSIYLSYPLEMAVNKLIRVCIILAGNPLIKIQRRGYEPCL